ncbi:MAG: DNA replication and repair protein RecF [Spirochaetaceae bacterium]|jgi:DNA replication and repair protein RecF|nr:DNA replication and repair protein RecF [Spirochaetaceae bacterium]
MFFSALRTLSFRNLADGEVDTQAKDVFLIGENGQGKTNFLEALYFCAYASSFRGAPDNALIHTGETGCSASAQFAGSLYNQSLIKFENGRKSIYLDGKRAADRRELLSVVPCIAFCHEDMEFAGGPPERRRWFFDQNQSLYDPAYLEDLRKYRQILKSRNACLKQAKTDAEANSIRAMLDVLDPQIAHYGLPLMEKRRSGAAHFSAVFGSLYEEVSGIARIGIRYISSWKETSLEGIAETLRERRETDIAAGLTLTGPHRDRYIFDRDGDDFCAKASTGQRRLLALLLRVAQARRFSEITGKRPVLLLDDVLLELDPEKRRKFLSVMPGYDQAFYTFLPEEPFERYRKPDTLVYYVNSGFLNREKPRGY